jgi:hypothetical protein
VGGRNHGTGLLLGTGAAGFGTLAVARPSRDDAVNGAVKRIAGA